MLRGVFRSHGRTASYPAAPAQIPACGTIAPGSSVILASAQSTFGQSAARPRRHLCNSRPFDLEVIEYLGKPTVVIASSFASSVQPFVQQPFDLLEKTFQALEVPNYAEVIIVSPQLGIQYFEYPPQSLIPELPDPHRESLDTFSQLL